MDKIIKSYSEFKEDKLNEMAIAAWGDWCKNIKITNTTETVMKLKYNYLCEVFVPSIDKTFDLYELNSGNEKHLKLGKFDIISDGSKQFISIAVMTLSKVPNMLNITNIWNVDGVKVVDSHQGEGIAVSLYLSLINKLKMTILGDEIQYFGARKLWTKLSKTKDTVVDIIDFDKKQYIEKNVTLHHGSEDWEFDDRVWSYDTDKKHIRLILKDIK